MFTSEMQFKLLDQMHFYAQAVVIFRVNQIF